MHFGFGVVTGDIGTLAGGGFDSVFVLSDDSVCFRYRGACVDAKVENGIASSVWRPWCDVEVRTWLFPIGTHHMRVHRIHTARPIWSSDAGFALGLKSLAELEVVAENAGEIALRSAEGTSAGCEFLSSRNAEKVMLEPNSHLAWPIAAMLTSRGSHPPGVLWTAGVFGASLKSNDPLLPELRAFKADASSTDVTVTRNGHRLFNSTGSVARPLEPTPIASTKRKRASSRFPRFHVRARPSQH